MLIIRGLLMKLVIQRVREAQVTVDNQVVGEIKKGLLLFLGMHREDTERKIPWLVEKVCHLRVFEDPEGKMNRSVQDVEGKVLLVSQFTLYANCQVGRRPSFKETMPSDEAEALYEAFIHQLQKMMGIENVATGEFGASMQVHLVNDGPVTMTLSR